MEEETDLQRAIAIRLSEGQKNVEVIDVDALEDDFEKDMRLAIELSQAEERGAETGRLKTEQRTADSDSAISKSKKSRAESSRAPILSERAKLERERLDRLKRLRPDFANQQKHSAPSSHSGNASSAVEDEETDEEVERPAAKRQHVSSFRSRTVGANAAASPSNSAVLSESLSTPSTIEPMFWTGELRQTPVKHGHPRKDGQPTFRLSEVIGKKSEIEFAIISSYSLVISWIYQFFDPSTPVILVAQPSESGDTSLRNVFPNWVKTTPFLRSGRGCMHMKFMLIFYKDGRLRVVVSTANLVDFDWRDIENSVWLQDIPRTKNSAVKSKTSPLNDFGEMFERVLIGTHVQPALATLLRDKHPNLPLQKISDLHKLWDWSRVKACLVPSIAGKHEGWQSVLLTGHTRLMRTVRRLGLKGKNQKPLIECQGSSIGTYSTQWINEFYDSTRGVSPETWLDTPKSRRSKLPWPNIKVVYPSLSTVRQTTLGELVSQGGGTIFCRKNQWEGVKFPRNLFHDSRSKAGPALMHSKMIVATFDNPPQPPESDSETEDSDDDVQALEDRAVGWIYVGSHNFTASAWGTLSGSAINPVLNVTNYELGVVIPLRRVEDATRMACFERPPRRYTATDRAWIQAESEILQASGNA